MNGQFFCDELLKMSTTLKVNEKNDYGSLKLPHKHSESKLIKKWYNLTYTGAGVHITEITSYGEQKTST